MANKDWTQWVVENKGVEGFPHGLASWLVEKANEYQLKFLLIHADDGVIWGRITAEGELKLSCEFFSEVSVNLSEATLQQARLFSPKGELLLWNTGSGFQYRAMLDGANPMGEEEGYEEVQWLWGTAVKITNGFALMQEGQEGLLHAPPAGAKQGARAGLRIRHYYAYDGEGQAYIAASRLFDLEIVAGGA